MSAVLRRKAIVVARMIHKKKPPSLWFVPKIVLPYGPNHFTTEQIEKAVRSVCRIEERKKSA